MAGPEQGWCQVYRDQMVGVGNWCLLFVESGRSQMAGTGPTPLVVGPVEM